MLEDRDYMRSDYRPRHSWREMPASLLVIIALTVAFALQQIDISYAFGRHLPYLELGADTLRRGYLWQLLTFQFLHAGILHLVFNLLGTWWFGKFVEERLGQAHFFKVYFLSGVAGGILQSLLMWAFPEHFGTHAVGASAGVCGLIAVFAMIEPNATILAYFVIPLRARTLLYLEAGVALFFILAPGDSGVAHGAHLGGILFAVVYVRWGLDAPRLFAELNPLQRKMRTERMIKAATVPPFAKSRRRPRAEETEELPSEEFISQQVDPILDKISAHGIQSLTERERQILQAARAKMSKR
jgi:membrane associated rhomboid family serine protease